MRLGVMKAGYSTVDVLHRIQSPKLSGMLTCQLGVEDLRREGDAEVPGSFSDLSHWSSYFYYCVTLLGGECDMHFLGNLRAEDDTVGFGLGDKVILHLCWLREVLTCSCCCVFKASTGLSPCTRRGAACLKSWL